MTPTPILRKNNDDTFEAWVQPASGTSPIDSVRQRRDITRGKQMVKENREMAEADPVAGAPHWKKMVAPYQIPSARKAAWQIANTLVPYALLSYLMYCALVSWWLTLPLAILAGGFLVRTSYENGAWRIIQSTGGFLPVRAGDLRHHSEAKTVTFRTSSESVLPATRLPEECRTYPRARFDHSACATLISGSAGGKAWLAASRWLSPWMEA